MKKLPLHHLVAAFILLVPALTMAQGPAPRSTPAPAEPAVPSASDLEARIAAIEARTDLEDGAKTAMLEQLRAALASVQEASEMKAQAVEFRRLADEAPALLESIRAELANPPADFAPPSVTEITLQQAEQTYDQINAELQAARTLVAELQNETTQRSERRAEMPERIARLRQDLATLNDTLASPAEAGSAGDPLIQARREALLAQRAALEAEIESLEAESASYDARRDLLPARRDRASRRVSELETQATAWQGIVGDRRRIEADRSAREAQRQRSEAANQHPVLSEFAKETSDRAANRTGPEGVPQRISAVTKEIAAIQSNIAGLSEQARSIRRRIEASGLNRATGLLLRRQFESLPSMRELRRVVHNSQDELERAEYQLIELQEDRAEYGDIDQIAQALLEEIRRSENRPAEITELEPVARELAIARRDLLDAVVADASSLFDGLVRKNTLARQRLAEAEALESFIEERILWVRNIPSDRRPRLDDARELTSRLTDAEIWQSSGAAILRFLERQWLSALAVGATLALLFLLAPRWRRRVRERGQRVSRMSSDALTHSVDALVFTFLLALRLPLLLFAVGELLERPQDQPAEILALGTGLKTAAWYLASLSVLRMMLRPGGLSEAHFRWPASTTRLLRRHLRWFVPFTTPLVVAISAMEVLTFEGASATIGRLAFSLVLLSVAFIAQRVVRPSGAVIKPILARRPGGWIDRLRFIWYPATLAIPIGLIVVAWLGFYYTALEIGRRLEWTIVFVFALVIVNQLLQRWLLIARRGIAIENAKRKRAQAAEAEQAAIDSSPPGEAPLAAPLDEEHLDLPVVSEQTRQLFRAAIFVSLIVGMLVIWSEILPALRMLDRVQLLPSIRIVDHEEAAVAPSLAPANGAASSDSLPPNGAPAPSQPTPGLPLAPSASDGGDSTNIANEPVTLTLADVGLALLIVVITWIAFRNLPALVEILVLQRLPLDAGSRYALSTTLRYAISIVGLLIAFNALGISWSKVQWLAAALTFGLAFGLQEIFANFVSGLIILGERPVRVGDTVTVGTVTGTVSRIRMRATTITDWDRKELIIPNKNFITGEVINWSLSDPILRVSIPVGVAYGSDTKRAEALLLQAAKENDRVIADPAPYVVFNAFGESSLDLQLRVHIPSIDHLIKVRHELHSRIDALFREADIEIAFPQRDLHVRSIHETVRITESSSPGDQANRDEDA